MYTTVEVLGQLALALRIWPCYNDDVGRRVLPVVTSRFCYRRREGCAMTTYESMMVLIAILNLLIAVYKLDRE